MTVVFFKKKHPKVLQLSDAWGWAFFHSPRFLEQMTGIEPAYSAWEADTLPLSYICTAFILYTKTPRLSRDI